MSARLLWLGALALSGCGSDATPPRVLPVARTALDSVLVALMTGSGYPAVAGAVIWMDSVHVSTLGVRKLGDTTSVTSFDRFHLGSNTKAMTATVIGVLVERGQLRWTSTPAEVFPELVDSIHPTLRSITLEQLLAHRAGVAAYTRGEDFTALAAFSGSGFAQRRSFAAMLLHAGPATPVGQYSYSNAGYALAAAMAERVTGTAWEALIRELLFMRLGVRGEVGWPAATETRQPWGHWMVGNRLEPQDPHGAYQLPVIIDPAGSVNMTIADYARFVQLHLRGMAGRDSIVSAATFNKLHTPIGQYALGWGVLQVDGVVTHLHDGSAGTFYATVMIQPERGVAVALAANASPVNAGASMRDGALALLRLTRD